MRHMLRRFLSWLDTRFPEKLEVTTAEYNALFETIGQMNVKLQQLDQVIEQVKKLTTQQSQLNVAMGFGSTRGMGAQPFER
jgi:hypothetical protein